MYKAFCKLFFPNYVGKKYDTVRYAFPLILFTALFAGVAASISENTSFITISTPVDTVTRDQEFYIDVSVTAAVPINAVDLQIAYPDNTISVLGIDTGASVITLWTEQPRAEHGVVYLRGGTFRQGFVGTHLIARIKARAQQTGEAHIFTKETQLVAGDGKGTEIAVASTNHLNEKKIRITGSDGVAVGNAAVSIITDTNMDGSVDFSDITLFMSAWFTKSRTYDFNGDGSMTITDFSILLTDAFFK